MWSPWILRCSSAPDKDSFVVNAILFRTIEKVQVQEQIIVEKTMKDWQTVDKRNVSWQAVPKSRPRHQKRSCTDCRPTNWRDQKMMRWGRTQNSALYVLPWIYKGKCLNIWSTVHGISEQYCTRHFRMQWSFKLRYSQLGDTGNKRSIQVVLVPG